MPSARGEVRRGAQTERQPDQTGRASARLVDSVIPSGDVNQLGLVMIRSRTVGIHPRFVSMLRELIEERLEATPGSGRRALGDQRIDWRAFSTAVGAVLGTLSMARPAAVPA